MICQKCNFRNADEAKFCRNCGGSLKIVPSQKRDVLGIIGFALSVVGVWPAMSDVYLLFFPVALLGLIFCGLASFKKDGKIKDFAIIGLVLGLVALFYRLLCFTHPGFSMIS